MVVRQLLSVLIGVTACVVPQLSPAQSEANGWSGNTDRAEIIEARRALMAEMERQIVPIDLYAIGEPARPDDLRSSAITIAQMLKAFPHLFPPTTNTYDAQSDAPQTLALPAVWEDFAGFYALSAAAANTAQELSLASEQSKLKTGAIGLRGACDACHALYLVPYSPSTVSSEDLEFDFDALFDEIDSQ